MANKGKSIGLCVCCFCKGDVLLVRLFYLYKSVGLVLSKSFNNVLLLLLLLLHPITSTLLLVSPSTFQKRHHLLFIQPQQPSELLALVLRCS